MTLHEAENTLKIEQTEPQKSLAILGVLPQIIANAVNPLENIEGIKILQGIGTNGAGMSNAIDSKGRFAEQVTEAALNYRANTPVVDSLLKELGWVDSENGSLTDLVKGNSPLLAKPYAKTLPSHAAAKK